MTAARFAGGCKLITCILPRGRGQPLMAALVRDKGIDAVDVHHARGVGRITPLAHRGLGETSEKDILTVAVPAERADEIFEYIYFEGGVDRPHGGLIWMNALAACTPYLLPELPEEG